MPESDVESRGSLLLWLAAVSFVLFCIVYLVAVQTRWGQTLDATALSGRSTLAPRAVPAASRLLGTIDKSSLVLVGGSIVLVALLRRRPLLALGAAVLIGGAIMTTEILKKLVLPRPDLAVVDPLGRLATFPSGHTTVAMSLAMAAMIVGEPASRAWDSLGRSTPSGSASGSSPPPTTGPVTRSARCSSSRPGPRWSPRPC
jgi:membrane-associated phospholipid phosphatase